MPTDISKSSKEQLFNLVIQNNPTAENNVPFNKIDFTLPAFIDEQTGLSETTIFAIPNSGLNGSVGLEYTKLDLEAFLTINPNPDLMVTENSNFSDIIANFNNMYGSNLSPEDYLDQPDLPLIDDEGFQVAIVASPTSFAYFGSLVITVRLLSFPLGSFISNTDIGALRLNTNVDLNGSITTTSLVGFDYGVVGVPTVPVGAQYTFNMDHTFHYSTLIAIPSSGVLNSTQATAVVAALQWADSDGSHRSSWKNSTSNTGTGLLFNLNTATVIYNGLVANATNKPVNSNYKYVLELQLRANVTSPIGNIFIHYNAPIDPLNVIDPNA